MSTKGRPHGKGIFIWQVPKCEGGDADRIAVKAEAAGLTHVLVKIANTVYETGFDLNNRDLLPPVVDSLRRRGIDVWGWHYVKGNNPVWEAQVAATRVRTLELDGYVIDAEIEYEIPGREAAARDFIAALRAGMPDTPVALSSYCYPSLHPRLPWTELLSGCDYNMPQVYWEQSHSPEACLQRSVQELGSLHPNRPVIPTGSAYGTAGWRPTADDLRRFFQRAVDLGLPAVNVYSWDWAGSPGNEDLWGAVAGFVWPVPPEPDILETLRDALNSGNPTEVMGLYHEDAVHVTASQTRTGTASIEAWYQALLRDNLPGATFSLTGQSGAGPSRHFTWKAEAPSRGTISGSDTLGVSGGRIQYHYTYMGPRGA